MDVERLEEGLWRWRPAPEVGCVYYQAPDAVVLFDPLLPPGDEEKFLAYLDRDVERHGLPVSILLTAPMNERSTEFLRERYHAGDRVPDTVESHPIEERTAYFVRPHRALVVAALEPWPDAITQLPVELVLVSG